MHILQGNTHCICMCMARRTVEEVEEACLQWALCGNLNRGLMLSSPAVTKGGAGATTLACDFNPNLGDGLPLMPTCILPQVSSFCCPSSYTFACSPDGRQ